MPKKSKKARANKRNSLSRFRTIAAGELVAQSSETDTNETPNPAIIENSDDNDSCVISPSIGERNSKASLGRGRPMLPLQDISSTARYYRYRNGVRIFADYFGSHCKGTFKVDDSGDCFKFDSHGASIERCTETKWNASKAIERILATETLSVRPAASTQQFISAMMLPEISPYKVAQTRERIDEEASKFISMRHFKDTGLMVLSIADLLTAVCKLDSALIRDSQITIIESGDGFRPSNRRGCVAVYLRVCGFDEILRSRSLSALDGVFVIAFFEGSESVETVTSVYEAIQAELRQLQENGISLTPTEIVRVKVLHCADGKWLGAAFGFQGGRSTFGCPFCSSNTQEFFPPDVVNALKRDYSGSASPCHFLCRTGCSGGNRCRRQCKDSCDGAHGLGKMTPMRSITPRENVISDILHLKLRLTDKIVKLLRDELLSVLQRSASRLNMDEKKAIVEGMASSVGHTRSIMGKVSLYGPDADRFLMKFDRLVEYIDSSFEKLGIRDTQAFVVIHNLCHLLGALNTIIRKAAGGPPIGVDAVAWIHEFRISCESFAAKLVENSGSYCRPLYLHILCYHLADQVLLHGGLDRYSCEIVEKKNHQLRVAQDQICKGGHSVEHVMRWARKVAYYILRKHDSLPVKRKYSKRQSKVAETSRTRKANSPPKYTFGQRLEISNGLGEWEIVQSRQKS